MAVVIETTLGDITVDLYLDQRPVTCLNFLKLCKMKYYNYNLFHTIRSGFIAQTGDPTGEGSGGESIFGILEGPTKRFFSGEKMPKIRHTDAGLLSMVCTDDSMVGSQFFFTLGSDLDSLDGVHCVIGEITEGQEVLRKLNDVICDETHRPYQDVRITHTVVLEDPFNDPVGLHAPSRSPSPSADRLRGGRIAPDEEIDETHGKTAEEIQELIEEKEAKARATILEIVGDIPDADIAPPENVLFVCKLNPVTTDEDLEIIFSRFGKIVNCEVIRDKKSGDSLQYAFIEFSDKKSCEDAYFKMDNVLIDDRRIHVDFSQSVSKIKYMGKGRIKHLDDEDKNANHRENHKNRDLSEQTKSRDRKKDDNKEHSQRHKERYSRREKDRDNNRSHDRHRVEKKPENRKKEQSRSENRYDRSKDASKMKNYKYNNHDSKRYKDSHKHNKGDNGNYNSHKHHTKSPNRNDKYIQTSKDHKSRDHSIKKEPSIKSSKDEKTDKESTINHNNKRSHKKSDSNVDKKTDYSDKKKENNKKDHEEKEPQTPPVEHKSNRNKSDSKKQITKVVKKNKLKKNRKPSTSSSDSDSSDSSSSSSSGSSNSDDTTSTDPDHKKSTKKRKRRHSTSSSSSSSDSSSSSSSDSSSDSSSSSSDDMEPKKKLKKDSVKSVAKTKRKC